MKGHILTDEIYARLMSEAEKARVNAYAPYSCFSVGAAILFEDGSVVSGCNVENASYGLTICAERNAMCAGVAKREKNPVAVAIAGEKGQPCPPCGACRQFLLEFNADLLVVLQERGRLIGYTLSQLLPISFSVNELDEAERECRN